MTKDLDVTRDFDGDRIILKDLGFFGYHGVMAEEAVPGQRFFIDLTCGVDLGRAGPSDELEHSISYAEIYEVAKAAFEEAASLSRNAQEKAFLLRRAASCLPAG